MANYDLTEKQQASFWARVDASAGPDACWHWMATRFSNGYGRFHPSRTNGQLLAHRVAYTLANSSIPKGTLVCHQCDVRSCCNPAHLFLGTYSDNIKDCLRKGRYVVGNKHGERAGRVAKLTDSDVREIRDLYRSGVTQVEIAARFPVKQAQVSRIVRRESWRHLN